MSIHRLFLLTAGLCLAMLFPLATATAQVAVIVHPSNPVSSVTMEELRSIYLGRTTLFGKIRIVLISQPDPRTLFDDVVLHMNPERLKRHWIGMVFSGDGATPPRVIENSGTIMQFVAQNPGAIAFMDGRHTDGTVKILRINGRFPADPAYAIHPDSASGQGR
jgi:ABC-type phosphate transport system substrate-binding protein